MINYKIKIDLNDSRILASDMEFVSTDVGAYKLSFLFFEGSEVVDVSDCLLTVRARRADGKIIECAGEITALGASFVPKNSMYAVAGELYMEIALTTKEKKHITTKIITAYVIEGLGEGKTVENDEISVFVSLLNQVQSRIDAANRLIEEATPQKGVDYWTDDDKAEIKAYVDEAILGGEW